MYGGSEFSLPRVVAEAGDEVRMKFIRKVYGLLLAALAVSAVVGGIVYTTELIVLATRTFRVVSLLALGVLFASMLVKRSYTGSLTILFVFAALQGFVIAPILYAFNSAFPLIGMQAGLITLGVFSGLTCYVFTTRKDFSYLGGILWASLIGLLAVGILGIFFPMSRDMGLLYSGFGALLFAGYILYDTSNVLHRFGEGDEPMATLQLYIDVVNLFLFILSLLGGRRRS